MSVIWSGNGPAPQETPGATGIGGARFERLARPQPVEGQVSESPAQNTGNVPDPAQAERKRLPLSHRLLGGILVGGALQGGTAGARSSLRSQATRRAHEAIINAPRHLKRD